MLWTAQSEQGRDLLPTRMQYRWLGKRINSCFSSSLQASERTQLEGSVAETFPGSGPCASQGQQASAQTDYFPMTGKHAGGETGPTSMADKRRAANLDLTKRCAFDVVRAVFENDRPIFPRDVDV